MGSYDVSIHDVHEYLKRELDDWFVICASSARHHGGDQGGVSKEMTSWAGRRRAGTEQDLRYWSARVDIISWKSMREHVDWYAFQRELAPWMRKWREERWYF